MKKIIFGLLATTMLFGNAVANNVKPKDDVRVLCHVTVWSHNSAGQHFEDHYYFYTDTAATCYAAGQAFLN
jgi:hypothetical protein